MKFLRFGVLFVFGILLSLLFVHKADAATYTVINTSDAGAGSLRQAIDDANLNPGADTINFAIPGAGVHTLTPLSDLPTIDEEVTIDGTTQPGSSCGTLVPSLPATSNTPHTLMIEIDGTNASGNLLFLLITATNTTIRGLNLHHSASSLIGINGASDVTVECNYLGSNSAGTAVAGTTTYGVDGSSENGFIQNNLIVGATDLGIFVDGIGLSINHNLIGTSVTGNSALPNARGMRSGEGVSIASNVVSGNSGNGVEIGASNFTIQSNFIGVSLNGSVLGNDGDGIFAESANDFFIGGASASQGNVVSGNSGNGITITNRTGNGCPTSINSQIYGNKIGTNNSGAVSSGYGNGGSGISLNETDIISCIVSVTNHNIGGDLSGQPNTIAGNGADGVRVYQAPNTDVYINPILNNSIFSNSNLGINLAADTDNDGTADADLGPNPINSNNIVSPSVNANNYVNYPTINSATSSGNQVTVNYNFQANVPSGVTLVGYRLDFYINDSTTASGYGEGKYHLGYFITNSAETNATHIFTSPIPVTGTLYVAATSTVVNTTTCPCGIITPQKTIAQKIQDFFIPVANAAEINPAPGTYTYGSTSEFSPFFAISIGGSTSSGVLASTGQNQTIGIIASIILATSALAIGWHLHRQKQLS